jgi:hypothetical protein
MNKPDYRMQPDDPGYEAWLAGWQTFESAPTLPRVPVIIIDWAAVAARDERLRALKRGRTWSRRHSTGRPKGMG